MWAKLRYLLNARRTSPARFYRRRFVSLSASLTRTNETIQLHGYRLTWIFVCSRETSARREKMKIRKAYERSFQRRDDQLRSARARTRTHARTRACRGGPHACFFPRVRPLVAIRIVCLSSRYLFTRLLLQDRSNNQSLCV